ncbi:MAG: GNAT family N-acetyltransferase [Actinomycetota bacterium]
MFTSEVVVRAAVVDDLDALGDIYRGASLSNEDDRESLLEHPEVLEFESRAVLEHRTRVALLEERIVGFASWTKVGEIFELDDLFVAPEWMRHGVGLLLVQDIVQIARSHNVKRLEVPANGHAMTFYERAGFVADGWAKTPFGEARRMHRDVDQ